MKERPRGTITSLSSRLALAKLTLRRKVWLIAAAAAPCVMLAGEPGPDARELARADAYFAYCVKVDPAHGSKYQERITLASQGATREGLARVRHSEEYQAVRKSVDDFVALVNEHNAKKVCSNALAQKK